MPWASAPGETSPLGATGRRRDRRDRRRGPAAAGGRQRARRRPADPARSPLGDLGGGGGLLRSLRAARLGRGREGRGGPAASPRLLLRLFRRVGGGVSRPRGAVGVVVVDVALRFLLRGRRGGPVSAFDDEHARRDQFWPAAAFVRLGNRRAVLSEVNLEAVGFVHLGVAKRALFPAVPSHLGERHELVRLESLRQLRRPRRVRPVGRLRVGLFFARRGGAGAARAGGGPRTVARLLIAAGEARGDGAARALRRGEIIELGGAELPRAEGFVFVRRGVLGGVGDGAVGGLVHPGGVVPGDELVHRVHALVEHRRVRRGVPPRAGSVRSALIRAVRRGRRVHGRVRSV